MHVPAKPIKKDIKSEKFNKYRIITMVKKVIKGSPYAKKDNLTTGTFGNSTITLSPI